MRRSRLRVPAGLERALDGALDRALAVQRPAVVAYLERARARRPTATPTELIRHLERRYLSAVAGVGAVSGGAAGVPGVGTGASVLSGVAEVAAFASASALYILALAEVHDIPVHDPRARRALVLTILLADVGEAAAAGTAIESAQWARAIGHSGSREAIVAVNARLAATRFGTRQSALVLARALPLGIGAGIGAAGNAALARGVVRRARRAFGPPPARWSVRVLESPG